VSSVIFPAGMGASVQVELSKLVAMAPHAAQYIDAPGSGLGLAMLFGGMGIPPHLQPEAVRQLAFGYALSNPPTWAYDPAKVEHAASLLVRRTEDQMAARTELLERFNLLNGKHVDDLDLKSTNHVLDRLLVPFARKFYDRLHEGGIWDCISSFRSEMEYSGNQFYGEKLQRVLQRLVDSDPYWQTTSEVDIDSIEEAFLKEYDPKLNLSDAQILKAVLILLDAYRPRWYAFNEEIISNIMPRLAEDDQRRAVRLMATVMAQDRDPLVRKYALDSFEETIGYLKPRDYMEVALNLMQLFTHRDGGYEEKQVRHLKRQAFSTLIDKIVPMLDVHELMHLAGVAHGMSTQADMDSNGTKIAYEIATILLARLSHMAEGDKAAWKYDDLDRITFIEDAVRASDKVQNPSDEFERKAENLTNLGFAQIGEYFVRSDFIIHIDPNGQPTIFKQREVHFSDYKIEGFLAGKEKDELGILYRRLAQINDDKGNEKRRIPKHEIETIRGHDNLFNVLEFANYARSTPLEKQLVDAGFVEDASSKGIFRRSLGSEVIVCVHNGLVWFVGAVLRKAPYDLLTPESQFAESGNKGTFLLRKDKMQVEVGGQYDFENIKFLGPLEELPRAVVGPIEEKVDDVTGFRYGGVNTTETIRRLQSINGIPINELEEIMRPEVFRNEGSIEGFLGHHESLLDVMAEDNDWVLGQKLTHQQLAKALKSALWARFTHEARDLWNEFHKKMRSDETLRQLRRDYRDRAALLLYFQENGAEDVYEEHIRDSSYNRITHVTEFTLHSRRFVSFSYSTMGVQHSPFRDDTAGSSEIMIVNLDNKECLECATLIPDLIERYGFYEGHGTPWRVSPQDIVRVFDFLIKPSQGS
jgi:hypothetical protein